MEAPTIKLSLNNPSYSKWNLSGDIDQLNVRRDIWTSNRLKMKNCTNKLLCNEIKVTCSLILYLLNVQNNLSSIFKSIIHFVSFHSVNKSRIRKDLTSHVDWTSRIKRDIKKTKRRKRKR